MDPRCTAQDVLRCDLCETPVPPMYCDICHIHLCKACVGEHLSDFSKEHRMVPFEKRESSSKCPNHSSKICELYCEQCDIPICVQCVSSTKHHSHTFVDIGKVVEKQKSVLQRDLQELKFSLYPSYKEMKCNILYQKGRLIENSEIVTTDINKHGEDLHQQIDEIIKKLSSDLYEMDRRHLALLNNREDEIKQMISEITLTIAHLEEIMNSDDVVLVSAYKSKNVEFRRKPPKLTITLPKFIPHKINKEHVYQQFGSLTSSLIESKKHGYKIDDPGVESSPSNKDLLHEPRVITQIKTEYAYTCNLSCLTDEDIWVRGNSNILKLYNPQRGIMKSIQTKSENWPQDIAVTTIGNLVYTDYNDGTVNIVKNTHIQTVIRLRGWKPFGVCSTSFGDLMVVMDRYDLKQTKVVRYYGFTEKQIIQYDDNRQPLYSSGGSSKYITQNRNLDVCVSDWKAHEVVVVNKAGKLRFKYTGHPFANKPSFSPYGITRDSRSRILTADFNNHRIHILDKDGQFIRYIDNCHLDSPFGLSMDSKDYLLVAESKTCKVKKIQYCK